MTSQPVRVGTITYDWYPFDPLVRRLAEAAVDGGNAVDIICLRQSNEKKFEVYNGVHIHRLPMNRGFGRSLPMTILSWCWFMCLAAIAITGLHLRRRYDVIHVHNMPDFLVFSALFPKLLGAKVILHVQDVSPELMSAKARGSKRNIILRLTTWQEHISTRFADHVVTVGWPFEELLLRRGVRPEKLTIILNSADPKLFPASCRNPVPVESPESLELGEASTDSTASMANAAYKPFIVMYHGTLAERNGLDTAIRAVALARQTAPEIQLHIQGRGEHIPALKELAESLGLENYVEFRESCPSEKIVDFVVHGDVGIIPYRNDGFMELVLPTKAYEFAWMHRPMIASDTRAIRSMFRPQSLMLCDAARPEEFADAIIALFQRPEKRQQMITDAAEDYAPYEWERMALRYQQLLSKLRRRKAARQQVVPVVNDVR